MATDRTNIGYKFENGDIPSQGDFQEVFNSFIHKDEDKADFQMVETGTDDQHYVTPALLRTGLQNIGIITGNSYMPYKEQFDSFIGNSLPLKYPPVRYSVKAFKNGQLLFEREGEGNEGDYIINYDNAVITFSSDIDNRNIEVAYWYKNLTPNPGGGSNGEQIDFSSFLHTSGNETKDGILTFNNTTPTPTSGIVLTNSGADAGAKVLDVTVSGAGSGVSVQNTATGTGIKLSNSGAGTGVELNSTAAATGDPLKVTKDNVVKAKIDSEGTITAKEFITDGGTEDKFVKGDGSLDPKTYAEDNKVIHIEGNETRDGALKLTHDDSVEDVLTIEKNNSANCLKLIQNSTSNATTSTFYTNSPNVNRKAISIQKGENENAFITHDGNVSGTSFTTLNEKADITDGFLTLAASTSPTATAGHAKLYAKTAGTTDLYVMGSDGIEKKIGASGGDFENVLHKTGFATETKTGELVIDSGINGDSGFVLSKLPTFINSGPYSTGLDNDYNLCKLPNGDLLTQSAREPYNVSKTPSGGGTPSSYNVTSYNSTAYMKSFPNGDVLLSNSNGTNVEKIPFGGGSKVIYSSERKYDDIVILANGDFLGVFNTTVYKVPFGGGASTVFATGFTALRSITELPNGDIIVADGYNDSMTLYKIPPSGGSKTVYLSGNYSFRRLLSFQNGDILFHYLNVVYKVPFGGGTPIIYASGFPYSITGLVILNSNEILVGQLYSIIKVSGSVSKNVLTTDSEGKVIKTTYLEDVQYAKLSSPALTGVPTAPTANLGTNNDQIATTAFVMANTPLSIPHLEFDNTNKSVWNNGQGNIATNTSFGENALKSDTTGYGNTAIGSSSLPNNTTGLANTAIGTSSLAGNIAGSENTAVGFYSLILSKGNNNTAIGKASGGYLSTGSNNIFIGRETGSGITTGSGNVIIGFTAINAADLTNNIIIANGIGQEKARHDGTNWTLTGNVIGNAFIKLGGTSSQYLMADGSVTTSAPDSKPYKVYTAKITQSGTNVPSALVFENTLGGLPVFSRIGAGYYGMTLTGAFSPLKTVCLASFSNSIIYSGGGTLSVGVQSGDTIEIRVQNGGSATDSMAIFVEIRVYN